jgi:8-oxo-dGTP pyrophosphatase MutT (NUDIX family)
LNEHQFRWLKSVRGDKGINSEVVMLLPRPGGRVLVMSKSFYPEGTYNLPSGGIEAGETPEVAFAREVVEETSLRVGLRAQVGRIEHHLVYNDEALDWASHVMLGTESSEPARPQDTGESISAYVDASASDLRRFAAHMRALPGRWIGFGRFRATALDFAADYLEDQ